MSGSEEEGLVHEAEVVAESVIFKNMELFHPPLYGPKENRERNKEESKASCKRDSFSNVLHPFILRTMQKALSEVK